MDVISTRTSYVTCTTKDAQHGTADPSSFTAFGVRRGIEAAVQFKLGRKDLDGVHVAIQGVGNVGYHLAKELHALGARISACDINGTSLQKVMHEFNAEPVEVEEIYDVDCDVFAPCALGSTLNLDSIKRLQASIVAGSANNQLAHHLHGKLLHERDILYAPDFIINAGGLIHVALVYDHGDSSHSDQRISHIYDTLMTLFERGATENRAISRLAEIMAEEKLGLC